MIVLICLHLSLDKLSSNKIILLPKVIMYICLGFYQIDNAMRITRGLVDTSKTGTKGIGCRLKWRLSMNLFNTLKKISESMHNYGNCVKSIMKGRLGGVINLGF